ncbi:MAG: DedA family protein [Ignavibacteriales bacterium]|nr:DedA family protein [Ignavibacteriales bacterium]MCF8306163.1 DedA family protein [Ignavibacteriales bacterium]MCF8315783.1 DedA family protein [Ignavibacteriales bacterium]MCF8437243.1 DedA family protein [Ignavibacteriales bacterium]
MKFVRRLYDWMLHWADTPYGALALFTIAFAEASFFPIPPDALLIALVLGAQSKAFKLALNCSVGSILGAVLGYLIGHYLWWNSDAQYSSLAMFFFNNIPGFTDELFRNVGALYEEWNFWIVFTAGFTPIPYKVFTVSGGAFQINFTMFIIASIISRSARFFLVAFLIWKYGATIKAFIDKYFDLLAILFTVLLVGGFVLIKFAF